MTTASISPRDAYEEQGYLLHPEPVVAEGLVRRARERIEAVARGDYDTRVPPWRRWNLGDPHKMQKVDQVHLCDEAFRALASHPAVGELVARATGAEMVQVWATQLLIKPPGGEDLGIIGWHVDAMNWPFWEGEVLTVWLGLDDVTEDAGPLTYVAGSHRWPRAEKQGDAYRQDLSDLEERLKTRGPARPWRKVPVLVRAGGAGLHARETLHGSGANRSSTPRIGLAINVRTESARPRAGVEDYGYTSYLDNPDVCPVVYRKPSVIASAVSFSPHGAASAEGGSSPVDPAAVGRRLAFLAPHLRAGTSVLDAGSGAGALALGLAEIVAPATVTGIDLDARALASARSAAERAGIANARFVAGDVLHALFEDGAFGAVLCHDLFAHLASPEAAVEEMFRLCAPGGIVGVREILDVSGHLGSVSVSGAERPVLDLVRLMARLGPGRPDVGGELKGMLHAAGFRDVRVTVSHEIYQDEGDLAALRGWLEPILSGEPGERAVRAGLVTAPILAALVAQLRGWPSDPGVVAVVSFIEYVARKPTVAGRD